MKTSVAFCTYNGEKYIREQLDSIIEQTVAVNEIVICDDGSTDATLGIIKEYQEKYPNFIHLYQNEVNLRSVKNFEKAITLCTGDIVFLSDQDDRWMPNKVEKYVDFFAQNPSITTIASNGFCMNDASGVLDLYTIWDVPKFLEEKGIALDTFSLISQVGNFVTGAAMAFRKEIVSEVIPFPSIKNVHHDEWIALLTSFRGQFAFLNEKYFYYRVHANQQVGGVSYPKNEKTKKNLLQGYTLKECSSFIGYKRRLKRLQKNYYHNAALLQGTTKYQSIFEKGQQDILLAFENTNKEMHKKYPVRAFLMSVLDTITNKRKIK